MPFLHTGGVSVHSIQPHERFGPHLRGTITMYAASNPSVTGRAGQQAAAMNAIKIRGKAIVRGIDSDGNVEQVDNGALLIRNGVITEVGAASDLPAEDGAADVIGGDDFVVIPGFVNAHHHVGLTPLQLGAPDLPLELWVNYRMGARKVDIYLDTLYSAFELVRSGVTTVQHLHSRVPGGASEVAAGAREVIRAYRDVGIRVSCSYGLRDQNRIVYEDDEKFYARLPGDLAVPLRTVVNALAPSAEENLEVFGVLSDEFADAGDVAIQLAPLNFQWCSDGALEGWPPCPTSLIRPSTCTCWRRPISAHMHESAPAARRSGTWTAWGC